MTERDPAATELARLRWRCRRGMGELDSLLNHFLQSNYCQLDTTHQQAFQRLLEEQDDRLWAWLSGRQTPSDAALKQIVESIRDSAAAQQRTLSL
ncbi:MAG: succinate dehydrogenase assembly factor 2 [Wenzhouxiangellaceae bacterium]